MEFDKIKAMLDTPPLRFIHIEDIGVAVSYHGKFIFPNYNVYACKLHFGIEEPIPFISITDRWSNWNLRVSSMFVDILRYGGEITYDGIVEDYLNDYQPMASEETFQVCCWLLRSEMNMRGIFHREVYDKLYKMWMPTRNNTFYTLNGEPISYRDLASVHVDDGDFEGLNIRYIEDGSQSLNIATTIAANLGPRLTY